MGGVKVADDGLVQLRRAILGEDLHSLAGGVLKPTAPERVPSTYSSSAVAS